MKKIIILTIFFIVITGQENFAVRNNFNVSFGYFYTSLQPYGEWIYVDGFTVWRPRAVQMDWRPYSIGRWSWTKYGWYWDSYEPFGWAVYHYGRWYYDDFYGWLWMPDYEWGPAWVEWRYDNYYIGWAPLPPYASFRMDIGIYFSFRWNSPYTHWNFVRYNHFNHNRVYVYFIDTRKTQKFFAKTKYRTNYFYDRGRIVNGGITRSFVESRGGYRIAERDFYEVDDPRKIETSRTRSSGDRIYSYKPDEKTLSREPVNERVDIKRGERSISLERDKVELYNNRQISTERNVESTRNTENIREEQRTDRSISRSGNNENRLEKTEPNASSEKRVETRRSKNTNERIQQRIEESVRNRSNDNDQNVSNGNKRSTSRESSSSRNERKTEDNNRSRNERSVERRR